MRELAAASPSLAGQAFIRSGDWWPGGMGHPHSVGHLNGVRFAYFARARRFAVERNGTVTLYDTQDHQISGVSQQLGRSGSLRLMSQLGAVDLRSLPVVGDGAAPM